MYIIIICTINIQNIYISFGLEVRGDNSFKLKFAFLVISGILQIRLKCVDILPGSTPQLFVLYMYIFSGNDQLSHCYKLCE